MIELPDTAQMAEADKAAIGAGTPGIVLMGNAGCAVFRRALAMLGGRTRVLVCCGGGNNGGDGFIAARLLREAGVEVEVTLAGNADSLRGDAAEAFRRWEGPMAAPGSEDPAASDLVIDALLGAGLDRDVSGPMAVQIQRINASGKPVLAVDLPSGVDGNSGLVRGVAIRAARTVTFFRRKPGHLLFPGRELCGEVEVADIGIPPAVLTAIAPQTFVNAPALWSARLPAPAAKGHKYDRGHALAVSGGPLNTGAARLAARAALRIGAGLVTLASPPDALMVNAAHLTAIMLRRMEGAEGLSEILSDRRFNAVVLGPALGVGEQSRGLVRVVLEAGPAAVLDADALTSFSGKADELSELIRSVSRQVVLTPHAGEFVRLFGDAARLQGKLAAAREAACNSGAVVVLKGADTVVAAPDGRASISENAPPWLATAGSGDVLAGMICGLLAQGMAGFEAACAGVWMHGESARLFGPGLIAEDIETRLPEVMQRLARATSGNPL